MSEPYELNKQIREAQSVVDEVDRMIEFGDLGRVPALTARRKTAIAALDRLLAMHAREKAKVQP